MKIVTSLAALSLIGLAYTGTAAAGPQVGKPKAPAKTKHRKRTAKPKTIDRAKTRPVRKPAELRCHIEAFADAAATKPIEDRASMVNLDAVWIRFGVRNVGQRRADTFQNNLRISSGTKSNEKSYELSLLPGFSMTSPLVEVDVQGSGVIVVMEIDTEDDVPEYDETLNHCMFSVKTEKLH